MSLRSTALLIATATIAIALGGCTSAQETSPSATSGTDPFPVTVTSALGDAVIPERPERVVTWGWSSQDSVLALGIVPVAMPRFDYGGGSSGVLPWVEERITELGGKTPTLLSGGDTGEVPFEEIAAARPDVIVAPYSGLTQRDFDRLTSLAPVVAYPVKPWALPWQDQLDIVGKALGMSQEAKSLRKTTDNYLAEIAAQHPSIQDMTFVYAAPSQPGVINVYRASDPRVELLVDLGMDISPSVVALDANPEEGTFYYPLSEERLGDIETSVLVMYFGSQSEVDEFTSRPAVAAMAAIEQKRFAPIIGESFIMASSAPSVLSIPWMLDRYVPQLAMAAKAAS